ARGTRGATRALAAGELPLAADDGAGPPARRLLHERLARPAKQPADERAANDAVHALTVAPAGVTGCAVEARARARRLHRRAQRVEIAAVLAGAAGVQAGVVGMRVDAVAVLVDAVVGNLACARMAARIAIVAVVGKIGSVPILVAGRGARNAERRQ